MGFADGTVLRVPDTGAMFLITGGKAAWLQSMTIVDALGLDLSSVIEVTEAQAKAIPKTELVLGQEGDPNADRPLFLVDNGRHRHLSRMSVFDNLGLDREAIVWVDAHGDRSDFVISVTDPLEGTVQAVRRSDHTPRLIDDPLVKDYVEDRRRNLSAELFAPVPGQVEVLEDDHTIPAYSRFLGGPDHLWVRHFPDLLTEPDARVHRWTVFSSTGVEEALVTAPPGFDVVHASEGVVLGVRRTDLDVPYAVMCSIEGWASR